MIFAEPPVDILRDQAAREAAEELSKSAYRQSGGSLIERALNKLVEWIADLLDGVTGASPNGHAGLVLLVALIALIIVVVLWRAGVLRTSKRGTKQQSVFDTSRPRSAAEYRAQAEQEASAGNYTYAVRSRFRACVAELVERTILDDRAGRTAYEVVADAGRVAPTLRDALQPAALTFTEVVYGNRPGNPTRYAVVVRADDAARTAKLKVAG
ncbi:DUF4129 domain-containing protein [Kribbella antibiotica]|uniref:DUF4129 domain-containing protein n=1 Tax=Kribbella antibiotica TaxID=190195 RepID=A0A4R4Z5U4_9ACTN|nr:DUF4129 domain-containing protein [Kribbella antibiotica]TDD53455.1 DUF4129 domain-containing protein [Kribbella antibiotica]